MRLLTNQASDLMYEGHAGTTAGHLYQSLKSCPDFSWHNHNQIEISPRVRPVKSFLIALASSFMVERVVSAVTALLHVKRDSLDSVRRDSRLFLTEMKPDNINLILQGLLSASFLVIVSCVKKKCVDERAWCPSIAKHCQSLKSALHFKTKCFKTCWNCTEPHCGVCEQGCTKNESTGVVTCSCRDGFLLAPNGKSCNDVNECITSPCKVGKKCRNTVGGFECSTAKSCQDIPNHSANMYKLDECCEVTGDKCGKDGWTRYNGSMPRRLINKWPWIASLHVGKKLKCTGVIINDRWVAIPSGCTSSVMYKEKPKLDQLRIGAGLLGSISTPQYAERKVTKIQIIATRQYWESVDIMQLNESLPFSRDFIHPICLSNEETPVIGETCVALGFVQQKSFDGVYDSLAELPLKITNNSNCLHHVGINDDKGTICAGNPNMDYKSCLGNSGGFLVCQRKNSCNWYLAGVKIKGKACAGPREDFTKFFKMGIFESGIGFYMKLYEE
uniref:coagulation factor IX-like n=1 Tax=Styela clava TaxID=7725 RepID=UPI001939E8D0|nr:coagulation factor IX-like [Styela clava]